MIEVEFRSFISKEQYVRLLEFFKREGKLISEDEQESWYFEAPVDVRIQRSTTGAKIWAKRGVVHDEAREEVEIPIQPKEFDRVAQLFSWLNYPISIKWFRHRFTFNWNEITVTIDSTKGYGDIIELEKMSDEQNVEKTKNLLTEAFKQLNVPITPREEFEKKYADYKERWQDLTKD